MITGSMDQRAGKTEAVGGGDWFLLALDHQMRRMHLPGALCRSEVQLADSVAPDVVADAASKLTFARAVPSARMRLRLPLQRPLRKKTPGRITVRPGECDDKALTTTEWPVADEMHTPLAAGEPEVVLEVLSQPSGRTRLRLTWHHGAMDVRGAECLLGALNAANRGQSYVPQHQLIPAGPEENSGLLTRLRFARESLIRLDELGRPPIASVTGEQALAPPPQTRHRLLRLNEQETRQAENTADRLGVGPRPALLRLAASIRALHRLCSTRGTARPYLVPVPQDRRRRGATGPVFGNPLTFLFYRIEPETAESLPDTVCELRRQMAEQMRLRTPQSFALAMEFFRRFPLGIYARVLRGPSGGQLASMFFSDTGRSLITNESLLGADVESVVHLPSPCVPPGVSMVFCESRHRLTAVLSWVTTCLSDAEVDQVLAWLRQDLTNGGGP